MVWGYIIGYVIYIVGYKYGDWERVWVGGSLKLVYIWLLRVWRE